MLLSCADLEEGPNGPRSSFYGEFYKIFIRKTLKWKFMKCCFPAPSFQNWDPGPHVLNFLDPPQSILSEQSVSPRHRKKIIVCVGGYWKVEFFYVFQNRNSVGYKQLTEPYADMYTGIDSIIVLHSYKPRSCHKLLRCSAPTLHSKHNTACGGPLKKWFVTLKKTWLYTAGKVRICYSYCVLF